MEGSANGPVLTLANLNPRLVAMEYSVRGPMERRANELTRELEAGSRKPFDRVIRAYSGDYQAVGQPPITFVRQVLASLAYTPLLKSPDFPTDCRERAETILGACRGRSVGAYTDSAGLEVVRREVARFVETRDDGVPCDWQNVFLSTGSSMAIKTLLKLLIQLTPGKKSGVLVPLPQNPLYAATFTEYDMVQINYYLDEACNWALDVWDLQRAVDEARDECVPRAIVVTNPGNPTGQVLTHDNIQKIVQFAYRERLLILADEVYQLNVYSPDAPFHSFKKVLHQMGPPFSQMELASFMSCSKGYMNECGTRAGYCEVINLQPDVRTVLAKTLSVNLCPPVLGQAVMYCLAKPPQPGEPSHEQFCREREEVLRELAERARLVSETLNAIPGVSTCPLEGSMYAFPRLHLTEGVVERARQRGIAPDTLFAMELLEATGVCVVPGSTFGQKRGSYHFRTTIVPQKADLILMVQKIGDFYNHFLCQCADKVHT